MPKYVLDTGKNDWLHIQDNIFDPEKWTYVEKMKFSLIMATLGRYDEIVIFLDSLRKQTYKYFELIIVDQNDNTIIADLCDKYKKYIPILIVKSTVKGLSINRNIGMNYSTGNIIAFPDDDCEYEETTLEKAARFFEENQSFNFYTCNVKDKSGQSSILEGHKFNTEISLNNFMTTGISFTIFVRAVAIVTFRFDERLGLGSKYGSGEESDLLLFLMKNNNKGFYYADRYIYHPNRSRRLETLVSYGKGFGALHKKAIVYYHYYRFLPRFFILVLKETVKICFLFPKKERIATMKGRIFGFINYPH
jgi:glycosyltransferase involved in cell wall biosynthesis